MNTEVETAAKDIRVGDVLPYLGTVAGVSVVDGPVGLVYVFAMTGGESEGDLAMGGSYTVMVERDTRPLFGDYKAGQRIVSECVGTVGTVEHVGPRVVVVAWDIGRMDLFFTDQRSPYTLLGRPTPQTFGDLEAGDIIQLHYPNIPADRVVGGRADGMVIIEDVESGYRCFYLPEQALKTAGAGFKFVSRGTPDV
jgi:hypothetical protein